MANSKIIIVVVTFNGMNIIEKCLESIKKSKNISDVIVIDNNSDDGTANYIKREYSWTKLIELRENIGFGRANNIGIKKAIEDNADYVFLLNQDAEIMEDTVDILIRTHMMHNEYGIISPIHLDDYGNPEKIFLKYVDSRNCNELLSDMLMNREKKDIYEIYFVNAAIWLLSRKCIETIGYFNPMFFMYGEDDNYIQRCKYHNIKVGISPNSYGIHHRKSNDLTKKPLSYYKNRQYSYSNNLLLNINEKYHIQLIKALKSNIRMTIYGITNISFNDMAIGLLSIGYIIKNIYRYIDNRNKSKFLCAFNDSA